MVPAEYIKPVQQGIIEAMSNGVLAGYPVVDVKAELYDGSYHDVDSSEMAFKIAGSMAFQEGNDRHYTILSDSPSSNYDKLEPIMLKIIKSITPKTQQKPPIGEFDNSSNNTDVGDKSNKKQPSFMTSK